MRVLIVEDQVPLADALVEIMRGEKYIVAAAHDGESGLDEALTDIYDVIVLDVMLPKMDGFALVRALRRENVSTPVLMLTAKDEVGDKIQGLDCGADDYMTKPFDARELLARVRALGRRQSEVLPQAVPFGDIALDTGSFQLCRGERGVRLGVKEFELMRLLIAAGGAVVLKEDMLRKVWGSQTEAEDNNVEVYISFLRKKFQYLQAETTISTVRGLGYMLKAPA